MLHPPCLQIRALSCCICAFLRSKRKPSISGAAVSSTLWSEGFRAPGHCHLWHLTGHGEMQRTLLSCPMPPGSPRAGKTGCFRLLLDAHIAHSLYPVMQAGSPECLLNVTATSSGSAFVPLSSPLWLWVILEVKPNCPSICWLLPRGHSPNALLTSWMKEVTGQLELLGKRETW